MEQPTNTVLITGGSGFLGSHLVDAFVTEGCFNVVAISRKPKTDRNPQARYVVCDVTIHEKTAAIIEEIRPVAIIHTVTPGPFARPAFHDADYAATKNLVAIASKCVSTKTFVYSGSAESLKNVSGAGEHPLTEADAVLHTPDTAPSAYARAKSASEAFVLQANGSSLATAVVRLPAMFGPREDEKTGIAVSFIRMAKTFATRVQLGDNSVVHDWIYVENAAYAHTLAVRALLGSQPRSAGEAYFVTDGAPMKLWDFVRRLWTTAGDEGCNTNGKIIIPWWIMLALAATTEIIFHLFTLGRVSPPLSRLHVHYMKEGAWFHIGKAREILGYEPLVSTDEGIKRTVSWFNQKLLSAPAPKTV